MFKLHYWVENGGDGNAIVRFTESREQAFKNDNAQAEGWSDSSASWVVLKIMKGKIVRETKVWDGKKFKIMYVPLEENK